MYRQIILSLLDIDRYKLTMSQFAYFFYKNVWVKYAFTNRTKDKEAEKILISLIPYIYSELEIVKSLRFTYFVILHLKS